MATGEENKAPTAPQRQAYVPAMQHYGLLATTLTNSFVSTFALFNAGAIGACVAIVPTSFGQALLRAQFRDSLIVFALFVFGFLTSMSLSGAIVLFAVKRYRYYRDLTLGERPSNSVVGFKDFCYVMFIVTVVVTIFAVVYATFLMAAYQAK